MRVVSKWAIPVLVEKPACLRAYQAVNLMCQKVPVWVNHTRLFDPAWRALKALKPESVEAWAGGVNETNPDAYLNWISHLVPMCLDLGFCPDSALFHITKEKQPLRFVVNGNEFRDTGGALKNLLEQFMVAEKSFGLDYALAVTRYLEGR